MQPQHVSAPHLQDGALPGATVLARAQSGAGWTLKVLVDGTRMSAHVQLEKSDPAAVCSVDDVVGFLVTSGLAIAAQPAETLAAVAHRILAVGPGQPVLIAQGTPLRPASRELRWRVPMLTGRSNKEDRLAVDLHEVTRFVNVSAGQVLCEVIESPAVPGLDVFGEAVLPETDPYAAAPLVKLGERVAPSNDNQGVFVASEDGCVRFDKGVLSVQKVYEVRGDVNFKVGNITFKGQVVVSGDVLPGFKVKATGDVIVKGMVENSAVEAGGDILITGGVAGRHGASHLSAGGSISARYLHMVKVDCKKDILIGVECIDSEVTAGGNITVGKGGIMGGVMRAGGLVHGGFIGSEMCVATSIAVGAGQTIVADRQLHPNVTLQIGPSPAHRIKVEVPGPITVQLDPETNRVHVGELPPRQPETP